MSISDSDCPVSVSFRIVGVDPDTVGDSLGLGPTTVLRAGTSRIGRGGRYSDQKHDVWLLEEDAAALSDVPAVVGRLVERLSSKRRELREIQDRADRVDILVGLFVDGGSGGLELTPQLMADLAELELPVGFDVYTFEEQD